MVDCGGRFFDNLHGQFGKDCGTPFLAFPYPPSITLFGCIN